MVDSKCCGAIWTSGPCSFNHISRSNCHHLSKTEPVTPPSSLLAVANAPTGTLGYQTMSVTQSASTSAAASGSKDVSKPATGVVTVYNAHSTASQQLIANTRFEASDGKIYRIRDQITVPGGVKNQTAPLLQALPQQHSTPTFLVPNIIEQTPLALPFPDLKMTHDTLNSMQSLKGL